MSLYFITGNKGKFDELKALIPQIEQLDIDLPELQEIDSQKIIEAKLQEALKHQSGEFIVEDTSLYLDGLKGLPGPLAKWFLKTVGNEGLYQMATASGNMKATAKTIIGYAKSGTEITFFEGVASGTIVAPRGDQGFGWDPVFQPDGFDKTLAEMTLDEKNKISTRKIAAAKLQESLG